MNTFTRKVRNWFIIPMLGLLIVSTVSCSKDDPEEDKIETGKPSGTATLILNTGNEYDFNASIFTGSEKAERGFNVGLGNQDIKIYLYYSNTTDLKEGGTYQGYISVYSESGKGDDLIFNKRYDSHVQTGDNGQTGNSTLKITSISSKFIKGSFSGVVYDEDHRKIELKNGSFSVEVK